MQRIYCCCFRYLQRSYPPSPSTRSFSASLPATTFMKPTRRLFAKHGINGLWRRASIQKSTQQDRIFRSCDFRLNWNCDIQTPNSLLYYKLCVVAKLKPARLLMTTYCMRPQRGATKTPFSTLTVQISFKLPTITSDEVCLIEFCHPSQYTLKNDKPGLTVKL